ncbi:peptidoglycan DD-metalloendopeptidase family protein [Corynebacterium sp. zg912]|uniref:M23 family metallopeptidase n=1 Tax=Corynebacterium wankanglinii TaxID=2735136 RepID=A0A7H0KBI9_9CORY|nr:MULTISPECIES: M23 family metallopeptidase [Corynebacterium]MBA1834921.1 M23 family metallopeptidase [Corynebacterium wankanglinii]MBA1837391.1 M23 family metallopeptidase [Corynebacterium wankanglinii]MCR5928770.1 peptidoglycan DD-metalloendopeptidase family protein [Corynebacterium sp. zg912]QNP94655.1 M23 family metallopeptidase [Corynebacterium wankanglinii]
MNRRITLSLAAVSAAAAMALAMVPSPASALTITVGGKNISDAGQALGAVSKAAGAIKESGATITAGDYKVVYDPRALEAPLAAAFAPAQSSDWVAPQRGRTADGRTVVVPASGHYTSGFGPRWGSVHQGIDIANSLGTPIYSVMDGTVIAAGPATGFGNWVVIKHDGGEVSVYGHMRHYDVAVGQRVSAGQKIASIGSEGQSTGPHLHFEIKPDGQTQVDPVGWFAAQGIKI